jgi:hypothetical protein
MCNSISCVVVCNGEGFPPLWDIAEEVFLCCEMQWRRFFFKVGFNGRGFPSLWDITKNNLRMFDYIFYLCIPHHRSFLPLYPAPNHPTPNHPTLNHLHCTLFHCGIQQRKKIQHRIIFLNFKCLSLPSR